MTSTEMPMCAVCRRLDPAAWTCTAFPDGIPNALTLGGADHRAPLPGDDGVRFVARDAAARRLVDDRWGREPTPYTGPMRLPDPAIDPV